jgi:hypothetical protein
LVICGARIAKPNYNGSHPHGKDYFSAASAAGSISLQGHALFDIAICDVKENRFHGTTFATATPAAASRR